LTLSVYAKIVTENEKEKIFLHKSPPERWFRNRMHILLMQADARGSDNIILLCKFAGQALLITSQSSSRTEWQRQRHITLV